MCVYLYIYIHICPSLCWDPSFVGPGLWSSSHVKGVKSPGTRAPPETRWSILVWNILVLSLTCVVVSLLLRQRERAGTHPYTHVSSEHAMIYIGTHFIIRLRCFMANPFIYDCCFIGIPLDKAHTLELSS